MAQQGVDRMLVAGIVFEAIRLIAGALELQFLAIDVVADPERVMAKGQRIRRRILWASRPRTGSRTAYTSALVGKMNSFRRSTVDSVVGGLKL
jgi:hypothetical protein